MSQLRQAADTMPAPRRPHAGGHKLGLLQHLPAFLSCLLSPWPWPPRRCPNLRPTYYEFLTYIRLCATYFT